MTHDFGSEPGRWKRWSASFAAVCLAHAVPVVVAAWWLAAEPAQVSAEAAILLDLPPADPAPPPPPPPQPEPEPPPPEPQPVPTPPPAPSPVPPPEPIAPPPPAPPPPQTGLQAEAPPQPQAPPVPRPPASSAEPTWESLVLAALERNKRYPREAQLRRQQGVTHIRFVIDRQGQLISAEIAAGSGFSVLDKAALDVVRRTAPFPAPPPEKGDRAEIVAPVEFTLR